MSKVLPRTRSFTIVAQDPEIKDSDGNILTATVQIPAETVAPGPCGYRVHVIDYDSSTATHYIPLAYQKRQAEYVDPFQKPGNELILTNPNFHAQNVYAIIMRTLARFEFALGRRASWGFSGHQLNVAPHAFADANAFYSEQDKALMFGYFRSPKTRELIFSCLSHDVVVHETTHALLDGLREHYTSPSSPEQAGFHEGFSDIVALLSVFSLPEIVKVLIDNSAKKTKAKDTAPEGMMVVSEYPDLIDVQYLTIEKLKSSILFGMAEQMGQEISGVRGKALRRSVSILPLKEEAEKHSRSAKKPAKTYLEREEFQEPHRCGELLVAIVMNAFLFVWDSRIQRLKKGAFDNKYLDRALVVEQGSDAANQLLTMIIRAIDYTPPTDITFSDFLSALLTADQETVPDDTRFNYRKILRKTFSDYGIEPSSSSDDETGTWNMEKRSFIYDRTHFDSLVREPDEVFRFVWDNRNALRLDENAYTKVQSVRPCLRISPDGFALRETVAEYVQYSTVRASELQQLPTPIGKPKGMPPDKEVTLYGGGTLIFDEYGRLKYHIRNRIFDQHKQTERLDYLWKFGYFTHEDFSQNFFSRMHLRRSAVFSNHFVQEEF
jgi:hypothetical protein